MREIPLNLLSTFVTFAQSANIMEAARKLQLSQPAVSVQLKKLEKLLPYPAFVFEGKKKILSSYGRALHEEIKTKLSSVHKSVERINQQYADPRHLKLRIGARKEVFSRVAPALNFPGSLFFLDLSNREATHKLLHHEIDLAITHELPESPHIFFKKLFQETFRFCIHRKLLGTQPLTPRTIKDRDFLTQTPCLAHKEIDPPGLSEWVRAHGISPSELYVKCVCEDWIAIVKMVDAGLGYSILPSGIEVNPENVATIDIPAAVIPPMTFYLIYPDSLKPVLDAAHFDATQGIQFDSIIKN